MGVFIRNNHDGNNQCNSKTSTADRHTERYKMSGEAVKTLRGNRRGGRRNRDVRIQGDTTGLHLGNLLPGRRAGDKLILEMCSPRRLEGPSDRAKERVEYLARLDYSLRVNGRFLALVQCGRGCAVQKAELFVIPYRLNLVDAVGHADTCAAAGGLPVLRPVNAELGEDLIHGSHKLVHLLERVTWRHGDAKTLFTNSDGRVVDRLDVDIMFR